MGVSVFSPQQREQEEEEEKEEEASFTGMECSLR
jgi:hypothetical protein